MPNFGWIVPGLRCSRCDNPAPGREPHTCVCGGGVWVAPQVCEGGHSKVEYETEECPVCELSQAANAFLSLSASGTTNFTAGLTLVKTLDKYGWREP